MEQTVLSFPPILALHESRTKAVYDLLSLRAPSPLEANRALAYCLAHHALEGAEAAARARDHEQFTWYTTDPFTPMSELQERGAAIVIAPELSTLVRSGISETPYDLLGPDTVSAPADLRALVTAAFSTATIAGLGGLLERHAAVICLLRRKPLGAVFDSWTITRLPGTVFTDHASAPMVLGRDLVHEAGHNWLNDALTATATKLPDDATFHSPWKNQDRPAFGFLHSCWAFPLTMIYTARILPQSANPCRAFLTAYLTEQRRLLAQTADDHAQALKLIEHDGLRERLSAVHRMALEL